MTTVRVRAPHYNWRFGARSLVVGLCAMFAAVTASQAGELDGDVRPLASPVSLSVSGSQPVATYTVKLTNTGASNTISNGRLVATTTVVGGLSGAKAVFKSASGATCSTSLQGTRVDCSVGSLAVNQLKEFTLTFFSPSSGTRVDLAWDAVFDSGTPPGGSNGDSDTTSIVLAAIDPTMVTSAVPPNETVSVFTGNLALPSGSDPFTVAINVPPLNAPTTASVVETDISANTNCTSLHNFVKCYRSSITIPGVVFTVSSGPYLTFVLRVDKSNIRKGTKIDKVLIQYDDNDVAPILVPTVQFCLKDGSGSPLPNLDNTPCIAKADDYTRKSPLGWFGFQWTFISLKNGNFNMF